MEIATRNNDNNNSSSSSTTTTTTTTNTATFQTRGRAQSYLDRERAAMPHDDSGAESSESAGRRKYQRTISSSHATDPDGFRKPSLPASATRGNGGGLESRPSVGSGRRRSALREGIRVPSGPREFPSPGKRVPSMPAAATAATAASALPKQQPPPAASTSRTFQLNHDAFFTNARQASSSSTTNQTPDPSTSRFSFGQKSSTADDTDSPTTPAERSSNGFDFVPTMNFDDFQNSITDPNWTSPLLSDFPTHEGGRALPKEADVGIGKFGRKKEEAEEGGQQQPGEVGGLGRTPSFSTGRRRTGVMSKGGDGGGNKGVGLPGSASQPHLSLRTRRQSTMPSTAQGPAATTGQTAAAAKAPRKSVGPGLITSTTDTAGRKGSFQHTPSTPVEGTLKPALSRTSSLSTNKAPRRTTLGPEQAKLAAGSTLTATTQSRANKVKSLQPPPRQQSHESAINAPDTPGSAGTARSKRDTHRSQTPSSGTTAAGKRQSTISGRASGLGARTISPTDARRLKRLSMMPGGGGGAPPMPTAILGGGKRDGGGGTTPPMQTEELHANPWSSAVGGSGRTDGLPRLTQPSPSLIPQPTVGRKMSTSTLNTQHRESEDGGLGATGPGSGPGNSYSTPSLPGSGNGSGNGVHGGGVPLSSKSSYSSLLSLGLSNYQTPAAGNSRLPTPKPRNVHSSNSSRYEDLSGGESMMLGEFVPPVPAIPKAYESPREEGMSSGIGGFFAAKGDDIGGTPRGSCDFPVPAGAETPRKRSGEMSRAACGKAGHQHKRSTTVANPSLSSGAAAAAKPPSLGTTASFRAQATTTNDTASGRKNANLQPLRLPPLNLAPISNNPAGSKTSTNSTTRPRPSLDGLEDQQSAGIRTPEPRRAAAKTPSTPMTASKATFFARRQQQSFQQQEGKVRSSSSFYALRGFGGSGEESEGDGVNVTRFWDDSDGEVGVPIPARTAKEVGGERDVKRGITPFASGSLPKGGGELGLAMGVGMGKKSGEPGEAGEGWDLGTPLFTGGSRPAGPRPRTSGNLKASTATAAPATPSCPVVEPGPEVKKEGGLRRKLSLGWRRSSSKAALHPENVGKGGSPKDSQQQPPPALMASSSEEKDGAQTVRARLVKRNSEMPPPKLPASAAAAQMWAETRPSLEGATSRRKSTFTGGLQPNGHHQLESDQQQQHPSNPAAPAAKTRALHSEQPQPIGAGYRASSWAASTFWSREKGSAGAGAAAAAPSTSSIGKPAIVPSRGHKLTPSTLSAIVKDKDDLAADEEMRRLSQKRKDVDSAARESEALKARAVPRTPMTPDQVLSDRHAALNIFERGEIVEFEREGVYFTGTKSAKKIVGNLAPSSTTATSGSGGNKKEDASGNFGYDDERGDYNIVLGDHLAYRYEVVDVLGKGSFGQVVRCVDHKEGGVVAIKIIRNKKRFHQQALVEVGILGRLGEWDPDGAHATLSITTSFYFRSHLCIVTPCLSINLYEFIRAHNFTGFSLPLIRRFARQLLACLVLLQSKRIIHCDLKPENILLCEARKADVRVIDFGSSCREEEKVYTYIQSRFYRSPEVILGSSYGLGIDMWSLGCILAELWTGYPLFPGENEQEQLACIMEIFGPPDRHLVERCTRKKLFFDSVGKPRVTVSSKGRRRRPSSKTLQQALKTEDEAFVDFVARCLRWDPERRLKPSEAVGHPFITGLAFQLRPGIPEEARRGGAAARVRSSGVVPTVANGNVSPSKRRDAFPASVTATPGKQPRATAETPQTALRSLTNGSSALPNGAATGSPVKGSAAFPRPANASSHAHRRHSTMAGAGAAAMAGSKRASNGAVLGAQPHPLLLQQQPPPHHQQRMPSSSSVNMAAMAAGAAVAGQGGGGGQTGARWRGA